MSTCATAHTVCLIPRPPPRQQARVRQAPGRPRRPAPERDTALGRRPPRRAACWRTHWSPSGPGLSCTMQTIPGGLPLPLWPRGAPPMAPETTRWSARHPCQQGQVRPLPLALSQGRAKPELVIIVFFHPHGRSSHPFASTLPYIIFKLFLYLGRFSPDSKTPK